MRDRAIDEMQGGRHLGLLQVRQARAQCPAEPGCQLLLPPPIVAPEGPVQGQPQPAGPTREVRVLEPQQQGVRGERVEDPVHTGHPRTPAVLQVGASSHPPGPS